MATTFDWVKLTVENSKVIVPLLLVLVSATGYNFNESMSKSKQIKDSEVQFVNVVNHLSKPIPKPIKSDCSICTTAVDAHLKEHH